MFIYWQEINFIPCIFLEIAQRYANLYWVLCAFLATHTQNDSIDLLKTLHAKNKPHIHFFLEMLHFKESCNLIGQQHFGI